MGQEGAKWSSDAPGESILEWPGMLLCKGVPFEHADQKGVLLSSVVIGLVN